MDFTSVEFYTIAFCVAMGLVGFFLGQKSVKPATSYITALDIEPQDEDSTDKTSSIIKLSSKEDGTVTINRMGVHLVEGETINIIATLIDDKLTIEEKKGKASALGGRESLFSGHVDVDFFPQGKKVYVRYDSSVTGQWCKFSFKNTPRNFIEREMRY